MTDLSAIKPDQPKVEKKADQALSDLPTPPSPELSSAPPAVPAPETASVSPPPEIAPPPPAPSPELPNLSLPVPPPTPTMLSEVNVTQEKPAIKSWKTTLAPSITPPKTNFNYKRQILPASIYRTSYDRENQHLPRAWSREEYAQLLFLSAARNDVDAVRALLNAGTDINSKDSTGQTPLMTAQRYGARDTAALLEARGAF